MKERRRFHTLLHYLFAFSSIIQSIHIWNISKICYLFLSRGILHVCVSLGFQFFDIKFRFKEENGIELIDRSPSPPSETGTAYSQSTSRNFKLLHLLNWIGVILVMVCFGFLGLICAWISQLGRNSLFFYGHGYSDVGSHSLAYGLTFHYLFALSGYALISLTQKIGIPLGIFAIGILSTFFVVLVQVIIVFRSQTFWDLFFQTIGNETSEVLLDGLWGFFKFTLILFLIALPFDFVCNFFFIKNMPLSSPTTSII